MAYIPPDACWYIAELVMEIKVEDDPRNVIHRNLILIRANLPEQAYERALSIGRESEISYDNPKGKRVQFAFRGLTELNVIHDALNDGAEILYEERISIPERLIQEWLKPKAQLTVFRDITPSQAPDYSSGEIVNDVIDMVGRKTKH